MITNYFKIAFRNLIKFKGYTAINILGLAIGMACCILIIQHLRDELRYDRHHQEIEQLYRVGTSFGTGDRQMNTATSPSPLAWTLVNDYPEVLAAARIMRAPNTTQHLIKFQDKSFFEKDGMLADSTFFRILHYDFIEGDAENALNEPFNVVINVEMARKLFGDQPALNKTIKIGDQWGEDPYKITGVFDPKSHNTHIDAGFFMNMRSGSVGRYFYALDEWAGNNLYHTYIHLTANTQPATLESKLPALVEAKAGERLKQLGFSKAHFLEPVKDIYLESDASIATGDLGDKSFIFIFGAIAIFILLIACINFMNLSTAKATTRAQEIGVRKVVGASRRLLSGQFITEAFLYTLVAFLLAGAIAHIALPVFNRTAGKALTLNFIDDPAVVFWMFGILLLTALMAGSYPAFYLSSFSPTQIFRGTLGDKLSARQIRKGLVVIQFIISIALIQGVLVIQEQMQYLRQKKLGFNTEAKLLVPLNTSEAAEKYEVLRSTFLQVPDVQAIGGTTAAPGMQNIEDMLVFGEGEGPESSFHTMRNWIDPYYLPMMQFELIAGRFFESGRMADTVVSVVINEKLMKNLGYDVDNVIGSNVYWNWDGTVNSHKIIGVINDFHASSLHSEIDNHMFSWAPDQYPRQMVASVSTRNLPDLISTLDTEWATLMTGEPFDYFFLDEKLQQAYENDRRLAGLIIAFMVLAIFISCLGLLGLASFAADSRTKEIGVRKILGASTSNIVGLLSKEFLLLVIFALIIASPIAFYFINKWLQNFHYHIDMPWWAFIAAGLVALVITFSTVGFQSLKAALTNPAMSLRNN